MRENKRREPTAPFPPSPFLAVSVHLFLILFRTELLHAPAYAIARTSVCSHCGCQKQRYNDVHGEGMEGGGGTNGRKMSVQRETPVTRYVELL